MNTRLFSMIGMAVLAVLLLVGGLTSCSHVQPGHVGIKVNNFGSSAGVDTASLPVGWYFTPPGTNIYEYPVFTNTYTWTKSTEEGKNVNEEITFQDRNGLSLTADVAIAYHVDATKAPILFQKYRTDMPGIVAGPLRNAVRSALVNAASSMGVEDIYGPKKAELAAATLLALQKQFSPQGLDIDQLYWASNIRLPQAVLNQINAKIANEQEALAAQANVATAKANSDARIAKAMGDAEAIKVEAEAIRTNPEIVQMRAVEKWNGELPTYNGGGAMPFIQVK